MGIFVPLVVNLKSDDNAAPDSPEVRSPSGRSTNGRRRTTNVTMKALVTMMGERKVEMKALAFDATFQEFEQKAAADSKANAFVHPQEPSGQQAYVLSDAPMASTLELISRAGREQHRTQAGVWSAFGKSYVCLGAPDVSLSDMSPVKRGDHARLILEQLRDKHPDSRASSRAGTNKARQRQASLTDQSSAQKPLRRSSNEAHESRRRSKDEAHASTSQSLPQLGASKSRRRDRVPFSEILFPRELVHMSDESKRHARARACVMGIGPGQKEEAVDNRSSLTESNLPLASFTEAQQKTFSSRSALIQKALRQSTDSPTTKLVINLEPLRLPPAQLAHQTSLQNSRRTSSVKRGSSAPGSPHSPAAARHGSNARAFGGQSPKPSALSALSPVAQFMLSCATLPRTPRNGGARALVRESSLLGHVAMVGRKSRTLSSTDAVQDKKELASVKRPLSSASFSATVPRLHTEFEGLRVRMRDGLKTRLEQLKARRERCVLSPRFTGTMSKLLLSQIRNVARSYPINTKEIWELAASSLQENADRLRARKEAQQSNAFNVFYTQFCALVQAQNTTDAIMVHLCHKVRSLLENGWSLQRPFLIEVCRFIAHTELASIFGSNPCLLPVLHFIRRRLSLPVSELNRILREAGIVFGSAARRQKETGTLGNVTLQKVRPV